jgi:phosphatidylglycerol:prolipoprotein diacylglycerol transferase
MFFEIGALQIRWYGVMMALGFLAGLINWTILGKKEGKDLNFCSDMLFWIMISGIIGGRLAFVIADIIGGDSIYISNPLEIFFIWRGGLIYYGGFIVASIALIVFARVRREKFLALCDLAISSVPLAHVFGRIGCFLNGCCYGKLYNGFTSVAYPRGSAPFADHVNTGLVHHLDRHSKNVYPVQLYEAGFNLILFLILLWMFKHKKKNGHVTVLYFLIYPAGRFCLEFLRGDARVPFMGLSVAQVISIVLIIFALSLLAYITYSDRKSKTPGKPE